MVSAVGRESLVDSLRKYSSRIPREHILFQPYRGKMDIMITCSGWAFRLDSIRTMLPKTMPQGMNCVTWLPKSGKVGETLAKWLAKIEGVSCLPMESVKGTPFNILVIAPRLDSAYLPHVLELTEFLHYRKKHVTDQPPTAMYGKGDFMVWSLVVDQDTRTMADLFHWVNEGGGPESVRVFTTLDKYLLGQNGH